MLERIGDVLEHPGVVVEHLGAVLEPSWRRLGAVLAASRSVLEAAYKRCGPTLWSILETSCSRLGDVPERLGGVSKCLGGRLQMMWPDADNFKKA